MMRILKTTLLRLACTRTFTHSLRIYIPSARFPILSWDCGEVVPIFSYVEYHGFYEVFEEDFVG